MKLILKVHWPLYAILLGITLVVLNDVFNQPEHAPTQMHRTKVDTSWLAPSLFLDNQLEGVAREQVIYGQELISNTAAYFGPHGKVAAITNGMNCQNCHLDAGTRNWGNSYAMVASTYPKFRDRSGTIETISKRVNDCFERSLNGQAIDTGSIEMQAIVAYINWIGKDIRPDQKLVGTGITNLPYLERAADPASGAVVYTSYCQSCHGTNGEGLFKPSGIGYAYPPLWGPRSYNSGAGLYRISRLAGYVKDNMPFEKCSHNHPILTDAEAWDVAAFINTQPRPTKDISGDWPDISKKPVDHPFGPFADGFSTKQHKYGPFQPIIAKRKKTNDEK